MRLPIPLTSSTRLSSGDVVTVKKGQRVKGHHTDCFCLLGEHEMECITAKPWQKQYAQFCKHWGGFVPPMTDKESIIFYGDIGYDYDPTTRRVVKRTDTV